MEPKVKITGTRVLAHEKYTLKNLTYQLTAPGKTTDKKAEVYYRPHAVAVLLVNEDAQTILLTKQFRMPAYQGGEPTGYITEACAGLVDGNETPQQTAIREVKEETGYEIATLKSAGFAYTSPGAITEKVYLFTAFINDTMQKGNGGGVAQEKENIQLLTLSFNQAKTQLKAHAFNDMKTILLLQHYFYGGS